MSSDVGGVRGPQGLPVGSGGGVRPPDSSRALVPVPRPGPASPVAPSTPSAPGAQSLLGRSGIDITDLLAQPDAVDARVPVARVELSAGLEQARGALLRNQPDEALAVLDGVWTAAQLKEEGWYLRAGALTVSGQPREGARVADDGLQVVPESLALRLAQSVARALAGDLSGARAALMQALDVAPDDPVLQAQETVVLARQGHREDALQTLDVLDERFPDHPAVRWARAAVRAIVADQVRRAARGTAGTFTMADATEIDSPSADSQGRSTGAGPARGTGADVRTGRSDSSMSETRLSSSDGDATLHHAAEAELRAGDRVRTPRSHVADDVHSATGATSRVMTPRGTAATPVDARAHAAAVNDGPDVHGRVSRAMPGMPAASAGSASYASPSVSSVETSAPTTATPATTATSATSAPASAASVAPSEALPASAVVAERAGDVAATAFTHLGERCALLTSRGMEETLRQLLRAFSSGGTMAGACTPEQAHTARSLLVSMLGALRHEAGTHDVLRPLLSQLLPALQQGRTDDAARLLRQAGDAVPPSTRRLLDALVQEDVAAATRREANATTMSHTGEFATVLHDDRDRGVLAPLRFGLSLLSRDTSERAAHAGVADPLEWPSGNGRVAGAPRTSTPNAAGVAAVGDTTGEGSGYGWGAARAAAELQAHGSAAPLALSAVATPVLLAALAIVAGLNGMWPVATLLGAGALWSALRGMRAPASPADDGRAPIRGGLD
jgi:cell pole-organizing protein PopZ